MTGPTDDELRRVLHDAAFPAERSRLMAEAIEARAGQALGPSTQERI